MGGVLEERRLRTAERLRELRSKLARADELIGDKACVYLTGSFARGEATQHSDLDLFIVGRLDEQKPALSRLDEIRIKANLIDATKSLGIPDFSGDGEYLVHYTSQSLVKSLGTRDDDSSNTFTARLLLLLESRPLLGDALHAEVIRTVVDAYWRDYDDHESSFIPGFLANDILRLWRTLCVNYEARTESDPPAKKAKRKLQNYKLKHSRLLTCFSAIAHLLAQYVENGTVTREEAVRMATLAPIERLHELEANQRFSAAQPEVLRLLRGYEKFLESTDAPAGELIARFMDRDLGRRLLAEAGEFGDAMWSLLQAIDVKSPFFRLLVV